LAKGISLDPRRIDKIVHGDRAITADMALRLEQYFGTSARFWLNLQSHYDLEGQEMELRSRLQEEVKTLASSTT
jgi:addiction module HigA family antidote